MFSQYLWLFSDHSALSTVWFRVLNIATKPLFWTGIQLITPGKKKASWSKVVLSELVLRGLWRNSDEGNGAHLDEPRRCWWKDNDRRHIGVSHHLCSTSRLSGFLRIQKQLKLFSLIPQVDLLRDRMNRLTALLINLPLKMCKTDSSLSDHLVCFSLLSPWQYLFIDSSSFMEV